MITKTEIGKTFDGQIVPFDHEECVTQLYPRGFNVPDEVAASLGILGDPKWDAGAEETKAIKAAPEDKAIKAPKETKGAK